MSRWISCAMLALAGGMAAPACGDDAAVPADAGDGDAIDAPPADAATDAAPPDGAPLAPLPDPGAVGGPLTITSWGAQPFLTPANLDEVLQTGFSIGREFFVASWVVAPNGTRPNLDGLGPLLHADSCVACHPASGRAPSLGAGGRVEVGLLFRLGAIDPVSGARVADPTFGGQLQPAAIAGVPAEGTITYATPTAPPPGIDAASAQPMFTIAPAAAYGPLGATTHASARLSPHLTGVGLIEAVDAAAILALEDPLDADGDGISGRAARLAGGAIGRFGWKAVQAGLRGQTAAAFANDMGIASLDQPDDCTGAQTACTAAPAGGAPEVRADDIEAVDTFTRYLGVPAARRDNANPIIARGYARFVEAGCEQCHRSTLVTGAAAATPALANATFHPYTDLLLHDLGPALADAIGEGDATASEWRTPPLWGVGLVAASPGARFLHDGRAATLADAIRWHGGEAERARAAFAALAPADAEALLRFLESL